MTKKEKHQLINTAFCDKYENDFDIEDEMGGRLVLTPFEFEGNQVDNTIDYHMSRHTVDVYNWSTPEIKAIAEEMEVFLESLMKKYDLEQVWLRGEGMLYLGIRKGRKLS